MTAKEFLNRKEPFLGHGTCMVSDRLRDGARLSNGIVISIQASNRHYCTPRQNNCNNYTHVEIAIPSVLFDKFEGNDFEEMSGGWRLYGYLPIEKLEKIVEECGGIVGFTRMLEE